MQYDQIARTGCRMGNNQMYSAAYTARRRLRNVLLHDGMMAGPDSIKNAHLNALMGAGRVAPSKKPRIVARPCYVLHQPVTRLAGRRIPGLLS
jgi:hypothetical protein